MADPSEELDLVGLEALTWAAPIAEPTTGELAADLLLGHLEPRGQALHDHDEGFSMGLASGEVAQHRLMVTGQTSPWTKVAVLWDDQASRRRSGGRVHRHRGTGNEGLVQLLHAIETHVHEEDRLLEGYEDLVGATDPVVARLVGLIAEDEQRHHALLLEMFESFGRAEETAVPGPAAAAAAEGRPALLAKVRRLLDFERADAHALRELETRLRSLGAEGPWSVIVELMRSDTAKHVFILEYLERSLS